jgi:hypothetical protein
MKGRFEFGCVIYIYIYMNVSKHFKLWQAEVFKMKSMSTFEPYHAVTERNMFQGDQPGAASLHKIIYRITFYVQTCFLVGS